MEEPPAKNNRRSTILLTAALALVCASCAVGWAAISDNGTDVVADLLVVAVGAVVSRLQATKQ